MAILKVFTMCLQPWKKILFCLPFFSAVQGETIWHQAPGKTARVLSPHAWWSRRSLRTWSLLLPYRRCPSLGPSHSFPVVLTLQCTHTQTQQHRQMKKYSDEMVIMKAGWGECIHCPARRPLLASLALLHFCLGRDGAMLLTAINSKWRETLMPMSNMAEALTFLLQESTGTETCSMSRGGGKRVQELLAKCMNVQGFHISMWLLHESWLGRLYHVVNSGNSQKMKIF